MASVPTTDTDGDRQRRRFLQFLGTSPLLALPAYLQAQSGTPPDSAADALDVMDFEEAARRVLPPAHWGYMATGVDDDLTLKANVAGYRQIQIRPRRHPATTASGET